MLFEKIRLKQRRCSFAKKKKLRERISLFKGTSSLDGELPFTKKFFIKGRFLPSEKVVILTNKTICQNRMRSFKNELSLTKLNIFFKRKAVLETEPILTPQRCLFFDNRLVRGFLTEESERELSL